MTTTWESNVVETQDKTSTTPTETKVETSKTDTELNQILKSHKLTSAEEIDPRTKRTGEFKASREQIQ